MKRHLTLTIAIMIVVGIFAISAQAQTSSSQTIRARIPFTFTVGDKSLPAGLYTVRILNPTSDRRRCRYAAVMMGEQARSFKRSASTAHSPVTRSSYSAATAIDTSSRKRKWPAKPPVSPPPEREPNAPPDAH